MRYRDKTSNFTKNVHHHRDFPGNFLTISGFPFEENLRRVTVKAYVCVPKNTNINSINSINSIKLVMTWYFKDILKWTVSWKRRAQKERCLKEIFWVYDFSWSILFFIVNPKITLTACKVSSYGVFFDSYFPVFGLNTGKYGPEKIPYLDIFRSVSGIWLPEKIVPLAVLYSVSLILFFLKEAAPTLTYFRNFKVLRLLEFDA